MKCYNVSKYQVKVTGLKIVVYADFVVISSYIKLLKLACASI